MKLTMLIVSLLFVLLTAGCASYSNGSSPYGGSDHYGYHYSSGYNHGYIYGKYRYNRYGYRHHNRYGRGYRYGSRCNY